MKNSFLLLIALALGLSASSLLANGGAPPQVLAPDSGSTALMLTAVAGGMTWCWKRLSR